MPVPQTPKLTVDIIIEMTDRPGRPVVLIERGPSKFYVDLDLVVLDHMPMPHLPIVEIAMDRMGAAGRAP